uniref:Uncharacterized protein n=1 Tax=Cyprinus carpio carpio TaxID=630221 RepID=A0A9J7WVN1_CYPCA
MNSAVYQKILKENVRPSQDNDPKHTSKSTSEWRFMLENPLMWLNYSNSA